MYVCFIYAMLKRMNYTCLLYTSIAGDLGSVAAAPDVVRDYVNHIKSTVAFSLDGMRVGIDCANGSACRTAELLFTELGAECHICLLYTSIA